MQHINQNRYGALYATDSRHLTLLMALLSPFVLMCGCTPPENGGYQGYLEGEFVYVASPLGGTLTNLAVSRGMDVKSGQLLFELESEAEVAGVHEAEQRLAQAKARWENLNKGLRPSEIAAIEAQLEQAKANLHLSETELQRRNQLRADHVISPDQLDAVQTRRDADKAQVARLQAELETAQLGARPDEINAAAAEVQALTATLAKAEWSLAQKSQFTPTNAWVHDTLYRQGEWVAAGNPVVSLLPPENIKVRFFVPEGDLANLRLGQPVTIHIDGTNASYHARLTYISTQAEFTPPVIYSRESRSKLVFMIEASVDPKEARSLRPGQPVDVRLSE